MYGIEYTLYVSGGFSFGMDSYYKVGNLIRLWTC